MILSKPFAFFILLISVSHISGCMKHIPADPAQLAEFHKRPANTRLEFATKKGRQVAFYLPPLHEPEAPPERINIMYPGIASIALGWLRFIDLESDPDAAYLLIDYPGRGESEGVMRPEQNYLNTEGALQALAIRFGLAELDAELNLMGHSFGTGAALQFAERAEVARIVLVAPYNTLKKAVAIKSFLLALIMPSQIDNRKIIRHLLQKDNPPEITILHGTLDKSLPVAMGRELAAIAPGRISYYEFADDDHTSILTTRRDLIFKALNGEND